MPSPCSPVPASKDPTKGNYGANREKTVWLPERFPDLLRTGADDAWITFSWPCRVSQFIVNCVLGA